MPEVARKQLAKLPETNIDYISAVPQWFKFVVDYTELSGISTDITLATLPIKSWIHAVHWKVTESFSHDDSWGVGQAVQVRLGDEDDADRWLTFTEILLEEVDKEIPTDIEDAIGLISWEPDFDNDHDLIAGFGTDFQLTGDLDDLDAGEMTFWFLLSSMNEGAVS